ncbi:MAG: HD domain-containing protein [Bacteroidota bacterium]
MNEKIQIEINGTLEFLKTAEQLKNTLRSGHTSKGRVESVAEHTWRLSLMGMLFHKYYPELDFGRLVKILIIHDMGEIVNGDIPAIYQNPDSDKNEEERNDFLSILKPLSKEIKQEMISLWDEYNEVKTLEAKLAKALDKLETLLQHNQGENPEDFDYKFNLTYGSKHTGIDEIIRYVRSYIDDHTKDRMKSQQGTK